MDLRHKNIRRALLPGVCVARALQPAGHDPLRPARHIKGGKAGRRPQGDSAYAVFRGRAELGGPEQRPGGIELRHEDVRSSAVHVRRAGRVDNPRGHASHVDVAFGIGHRFCRVIVVVRAELPDVQRRGLGGYGRCGRQREKNDGEDDGAGLHGFPPETPGGSTLSGRTGWRDGYGATGKERGAVRG